MGDVPTWSDFVAGWELGIYGPPVFCGVLSGAMLGYLGVLVVLRRMVFFAAGVSQASGLGVALTFWAGIHLGIEVHPVIGALGAAFIATAIASMPSPRWGLSREALLGVVYVGAWTLAVLVGDRITQEAHDIASILFGTAVLVDDSDLVWVVAVAAVVALAHVFFHRGFVFAAFDPEGARVQGLPVATLDLMSWALVALAVAVTTRALGVLPVFAFAVLPALAALAWVPRLRFVLPIAMAIGAASGGLGYLAAFFGELPVGASQAAVALGFFLAAWSSRAGVATLTRSWRLGSG